MKLAESTRLAIMSLLLAVVLMITTGQALAFNPFQPASCNNSGQSQVCVCQSNTSTTAICSDSKGVNQNPVANGIKAVVDIIALLAGVAAVITIVVAGFNYVTSGGNAETTKKARGRITGALIGIVIIALAWAIVSFVVSEFIK